VPGAAIATPFAVNPGPDRRIMSIR